MQTWFVKINVYISSSLTGGNVYLACKGNIMPRGADENLHDMFSVHSGTLAIQASFAHIWKP